MSSTYIYSRCDKILDNLETLLTKILKNLAVLTTATLLTGNIGFGYQVSSITAHTTYIRHRAFQHRGAGISSTGSIFIFIENTSMKQHALIGWIKRPVGAV